MENNFIQMTTSAVRAVAYTICPNFKNIIDCVQLYFTNGERIKLIICQIRYELSVTIHEINTSWKKH